MFFHRCLIKVGRPNPIKDNVLFPITFLSGHRHLVKNRCIFTYSGILRKIQFNHIAQLSTDPALALGPEK